MWWGVRANAVTLPHPNHLHPHPHPHPLPSPSPTAASGGRGHRAPASSRMPSHGHGTFMSPVISFHNICLLWRSIASCHLHLHLHLHPHPHLHLHFHLHLHPYLHPRPYPHPHPHPHLHRTCVEEGVMYSGGGSNAAAAAASSSVGGGVYGGVGASYMGNRGNVANANNNPNDAINTFNNNTHPQHNNNSLHNNLPYANQTRNMNGTKHITYTHYAHTHIHTLFIHRHVFHTFSLTHFKNTHTLHNLTLHYHTFAFVWWGLVAVDDATSLIHTHMPHIHTRSHSYTLHIYSILSHTQTRAQICAVHLLWYCIAKHCLEFWWYLLLLSQHIHIRIYTYTDTIADIYIPFYSISRHCKPKLTMFYWILL